MRRVGAVDAMWAYLSSKPGMSPDAPLFGGVGGGPLLYTTVQARLKKCAKAIGLDPADFGSHSLRSGGCTSLRAAGVSWEVCKVVGRWRSNSALRYSQLHPSDIVDLASLIQNAPACTSPVSFSQAPEDVQA